MGNKLGSQGSRHDAEYIEEDSISKTELKHLRQMLEGPNSDENFDISFVTFSNFFKSKVYPSFGGNLWRSINFLGSPCIKFSDFYKFTVLSCKTSVSSCMKCTIEVFRVVNENSNLYDAESFLLFCCEIGNPSLSLNSINVLGRLLYRHFLQKTFPEIVKGGIDSSPVGFEMVTILSWVNEWFPCISQLLFSHMNLICFADTVLAPSSSFKLFHPPNLILPDSNSESMQIVKNNEVYLLSLQSEKLQGNWKLLYNSNLHGRSFNRIAHHLLGYDGPTCILIRCDGEPVETVIGMFSESRWKDTNRFYGSASNILFTILPDLNIYGASGSTTATSAAPSGNTNCSTNYQYLNLKTYGYPHGFGMGGHLGRFRFFIPDTMDEGSGTDKVCVANEDDMTFESGAFVASPYPGDEILNREYGGKFNVDSLEIWACGGDELIQNGLIAQAKDRDIRNENINKAKQCDKAAFFGSEFDKEFLLSKTFAHRKEMEARDEECM